MVGGSGGLGATGGSVVALTGDHPGGVDSTLLEPRPHSDLNGALAWSPTPSLQRQVFFCDGDNISFFYVR